LKKFRIEDDQAVITELGKQFLVVYTDKLGLVARCYYDKAGKCQVELKEKLGKVVVTWEASPASPSSVATPTSTPTFATEPTTQPQISNSPLKQTAYSLFQKVKVYFQPTNTRPVDIEAVLALD